MKQEDLKHLESDRDGLQTYEYLVNNIHDLSDEELTQIVDHLAQRDHSGQYLASGIRYMNGVDKFKFGKHIERMTAMTIDRDREHKFIGDLIIRLYGADYYDKAVEFKDDDNFRRMFKRLYPDGAL